MREKIINLPVQSSNLQKIIEKGLAIAENLSEIWAPGGYAEKRKIQKPVFPDGITYNKEEDQGQTFCIKSLFLPIPILSRFAAKNKNGFPIKESHSSRWVTLTSLSSNFFASDLSFVYKFCDAKKSKRHI